MPSSGFQGSLTGPKVDVAIDMGNPLLNITVDGFLKIGAVAASRRAAEEVDFIPPLPLDFTAEPTRERFLSGRTSSRSTFGPTAILHRCIPESSLLSYDRFRGVLSVNLRSADRFRNFLRRCISITERTS